MGKTGRKILNDTLKEWDLDYEEKKSLTSNDSFILNIKKIKFKYRNNSERYFFTQKYCNGHNNV